MLNKTYLEDELWNIIRINPKELPIGKHQIIPSTLFLRFNHHSVNEYEATFTLNKEDSLSIYKIEYHLPEPRTLTIQFKTEIPHTILGWEEEYKDIAWNSERKVLRTTATLKKSIRLDYWNKNKIEHQKLKQLLK